MTKLEIPVDERRIMDLAGKVLDGHADDLDKNSLAELVLIYFKHKHHTLRFCLECGRVMLDVEADEGEPVLCDDCFDVIMG